MGSTGLDDEGAVNMQKTVAITLSLMLGLGAPQAFAQQNPMSSGPVGTPITPPQVGAWCFTGSISSSEAKADAQAQGFAPIETVRGFGYRYVPPK